ncbi:pentatricopeptide repeat-containing protein At3g62470, mitochondrial-like [Magnolia sinica]|uniref:pentatricopeptide repeat-containing protein At3g62470, mitochondrial-like n=1 Tax=Magnolia sinica TaxID=86752 RepID=UPI00265AE754|nr:pentatricopeptide repeat-containing protein At3g62470, mitochondrial-like [Magnolia sinica]
MLISKTRVFSRVLNGDGERVALLNSRAFFRVWNADAGTERRGSADGESNEGFGSGNSRERMLVLNGCVGKASVLDPRVFRTVSNGCAGKFPILDSRWFSNISNRDPETADEIGGRSEFDDGDEGIKSENPKEKMPVLSSRVSSGVLDVAAMKISVLNSRSFCSAVDGDSESDDETDATDGMDYSNEGLKLADPEEVDRVCKVIEDLFAADRNMEAVLDQCNINLSHSLIVDVLARFCHARKPAFRFFCWAGQKPGFSHDSRTYNAMMSILGKTRQFESMVEMLEDMGKKGLLTMDTFVIAIRAFAAAREMKKAVGIFELMKRYDFKAGVETLNSLLDALARVKLGKEAQALFEKLKDQFSPDLRTYSILLAGWCKVKNLMEAGKVWNEMIDKGLKPDIVAHNTMLEGLFRGRRRSEAIKLFELMKAKGPSPNVRSYTILIRDLCKGNKMEAAVGYFDEMLADGCQPDAAVYTCLIVGFGNQKKMDKVYGLLQEMKEKGCPPDVRTYNALIKLMTNRNMPDDAVRIYKRMVGNGFEPTIHTYNMLMKSYFRSKNYDMGRAVWEEMGKKGCCPDDNSYIVFISGLISQGRSEEACKYIEDMINKGMKAPQLDYNKFAADFSRAGKPDILNELAQKMKFSGKFEVSNMFARWAEMMKKRVKQRNPDQTGQRFF